MIIAHGIDLVDVEQVRKLLAGERAHATSAWLTERERGALDGDAGSAERIASRVAIKEAVLKALGTGLGEGANFLNIEISTAVSGAPSVELTGAARTRAEELGISRWLVSASHEGNLAIGSAIAVQIDAGKTIRLSAAREGQSRGTEQAYQPPPSVPS